jgi:choline kinase
VEHLVIVTGFGADKLQGHCEERGYTVRFVYNPFWDRCNVLGSFYLALPHIRTDFLYLHGDTIAEPAVWDRLLHGDGDIALPYDAHSCGLEEMKVRLENGKLVRISKSIDPKEATGEFLGIAAFTSSTLAHIEETARRLFEVQGLDCYMEAYLAECLSLPQPRMSMVNVTGLKWIEVDFPEDYQKAQTLFGSISPTHLG